MLMAAGLGTRLKPFTDRVPKALIPLLGSPIAQYVVDSLIASGVTRTIANVHHLPTQSRAGLIGLEGAKGFLEISDESDLLLGSAGGIRKALKQFKSDAFFLANADVLCDVDWVALASCHKKLRDQRGVKLTLAVFRAGPPGGKYREILLDPSQELISGLGELSVGRPYFIGAAVLEKEAFEKVPEQGPSEFVPLVLEAAIQERKAGAFLTEGSWYDLGSPLLWHKTHLSLIHRLEVDRFPSHMSQLWKKRIEKLNSRVGQRIWISKGSPRPKSILNWAFLSYWDGRGLNESQGPVRLGPEAILYGEADPSRTEYHAGIGFKDLWHEVGQKKD